ncbi:hypothetical protein AB0284_22365 [Pseudarthrobacter phenanthrenivorans]|uniref:hypothetical protein n=1 Tax=Micrococcaceae TaxID=1268 RepID=UPI0012F131B4|nr:hypothetical protein [Micrococcus sp. 116]VWX45228.1 conserved hypothetical protein [Micrococcus sp. 116]
MHPLIHTSRVLHFCLTHPGSVAIPAEVCPPQMLGMVYGELEQWGVVPADEPALAGPSPIIIQPSGQGAAQLVDAQYREQEIGWRILEALTAPGAGPEVLGGLTGQSVGEIPLESAELSAVATELAQMGLIDSRRTADRLHAHVRLSPDGRRLVTSQRAPFPVHLDGTTPSASNASATTYQFINHGQIAAAAMGASSTATGTQTIHHGADLTEILNHLRQAIETQRPHLEDRADELLDMAGAVEDIAPAHTASARSMLGYLSDKTAEWLGTGAGAGIIALATQAQAALGA